MNTYSFKQQLPITIAIIAIVIGAVLMVRGNQVQQPQTQESTLQQITQRGHINVCYGVYPPAVIKDAETGELSGHDVDAIKSIASRINVDVEFHEQSWGNMAAAVQSGVCDVSLSLFAQIPRATAVTFTDPLYYVGDSAMVREGDNRFSNIMDADKENVKVVVANGESGHNFVKDNFTKAEIVVIDVEAADLTRFLLEVTSGRADIAIADAHTISLFVQEHDGVTDLFADKAFNLNPTSFAVAHGDADFYHFMNTAVRYLITSGEFSALEEKYDAKWLHKVETYSVN